MVDLSGYTYVFSHMHTYAHRYTHPNTQIQVKTLKL